MSRVAPGDKLRIARALHSRGHVVAMTGDEVTMGRAPAGGYRLAVGRSGLTWLEAADLVLAGRRLATIVAAVEPGRATRP